MKCLVCGAEVAEGAAFCTTCGASMAVAHAEAAMPVEPVSEQPAEQPAMEADPAPAPAAPEPAAAQGEPIYANQAAPNMYTQQAPQYAPPVYFDPTDHTAEFTAKDISENKVIAMMPYLMGTVGVVIALLAAKESPYAGFHVRQALKITVVQVLLVIIAAALCWTIVVPIVVGIASIVLVVIRIICFFRVCFGSAKEVPLLSSLGFLK